MITTERGALARAIGWRGLADSILMLLFNFESQESLREKKVLL